MDEGVSPGARGRETRLLLATIVVSVVMLVVLARFRFPEQGVGEMAEPAPAPLERLAAQGSYDDLASTMADLSRRVGSGLTIVRIAPTGALAVATRVSPDRAVLMLRPGESIAAGAPQAPSLLAREPASAIAVISLAPSPDDVVTPRSGPPRTGPRYVAVVDATASGAALRPVYVGDTAVTNDPATGRPVLSMTVAPNAVAAGLPLFTLAGTFIGIATAANGAVTIVPADALKALADDPPAMTPEGELGIEVQPLTEPLARISGAAEGVMVTSVETDGPAAGTLAPGDVLQSIDGKPVGTPIEFAAIERTRAPGRPIAVIYVRRGRRAGVQITARDAGSASRAEGAERDPGIIVRALSGGRLEITGVRRGGSGERAGLKQGDVILAVDGEPAGSDLSGAFAALPSGGGMLVTIDRDGVRRVLGLEKR